MLNFNYPLQLVLIFVCKWWQTTRGQEARNQKGQVPPGAKPRIAMDVDVGIPGVGDREQIILLK